MATIKALIVGVSDYSQMEMSNLPFCIQDIKLITSAFETGLKVESKDIIVCGDSGSVSHEELMLSLQKLSDTVAEDDTLLFYFSGHGGTKINHHYIALSDDYLGTEELILHLEEIPAKNKVIFLDCCMAGNFTVDNPPVFYANETADKFAGKGYAVFASSNAEQVSYRHSTLPISLFTKFLSEAITSPHMIREGKKSLHDIKKLLFMFLEIWNKNNLEHIQNPVYRASIGGTIYFQVQDYHPYVAEKIFLERDEYIISSVEPSHVSGAKRFSVDIILKEAFSLHEISILNKQIIEEVKYLEVYGNSLQEQRWRGQPANLIFCYFGLDEIDILNRNFICLTTWADETQDREWWYRKNRNCEIINDIHFKVPPYYESMKAFNQENTDCAEKLVLKTRPIITDMVTLAEEIILEYNEFINGTLKKQELLEFMTGIIPQVNKLYFAEGNLSISPPELAEWSQCCRELSVDIHNLTLYYNPQFMSQRSPENRRQCMDMTIKQYYASLENLKDEDAKLDIASMKEDA